VTAQRRHALASRRLPYLDSAVTAATGKLFAVWAPCHRVDPVFAMRWVSSRRKSGKGRKLDTEKKISYFDECPLVFPFTLTSVAAFASTDVFEIPPQVSVGAEEPLKMLSSWLTKAAEGRNLASCKCTQAAKHPN
jgi:hypothetical protein